MLSRVPFAKTTVGALALVTALLTVGLTASDEGLFSIAVRPVFLRLGIDVDVKLGRFHVHASWSAVDPQVLTTNAPPELF